jgi:Lrp/AsnC family transcriptional regulator, leucine-responsive regulatory protein
MRNPAKCGCDAFCSEELVPQDRRFQAFDEIDLAIVKILQERGRDTFAQIGKTIGLSATSVGERVRRLEHLGVIEGYRARISPEKLGYPLTAFILVRPRIADEEFAKRAAERSEIVECSRVTGDVSFVTRALVADVRHLERLLNHLESVSSHVVTLLILSVTFERPVIVGDQKAG